MGHRNISTSKLFYEDKCNRIVSWRKRQCRKICSNKFACKKKKEDSRSNSDK